MEVIIKVTLAIPVLHFARLKWTLDVSTRVPVKPRSRLLLRGRSLGRLLKLLLRSPWLLLLRLRLRRLRRLLLLRLLLIL